MGSSRGARALCWRLIGCLILAALLGLPPSTPARAAELTVQSETATAAFPRSINFTLVADVPQPATTVELRYHPAFSPVTDAARPSFRPGTHIDVSYPVDMTTHYLPPGVDIVYRWRVTEQDGTTVNTPEQTVFYMDPGRQWQKLTEGPVTLYYYAGNPSFAQDAIDTTVRSITRFDQTFAITTTEPIRVVMYGSPQDFSAVLPVNSDQWVGGFTDPGLHLIVVGIQPGVTSEVHRMLSHEVVHIVMAEVTDNPFNEPPTWLNEGLASYYQEVQDDRFPTYLDNAVRRGQLDTVRGLNSSFSSDPNAALLSYAESESIVRFLVTKMGPDKMAALIKVYANGVSYDDAVQQALGISVDELDREWKASLGYRGDSGPTAQTGALGGPGPGATEPLAADLTRFGPFAIGGLLVIAGGLAAARLRVRRHAAQR